MWFQLYSHTSLYKDEGDDVAKSTVYSPRPRHHFLPRKNKDVETPGTSSAIASTEVTEESRETPEADLETPQMNLLITICLLAAVTAVS